jgi:Uma2 family endonuclease
MVLAVEVVSPSTRTRDRVTKRHLYGRLGIPPYWMVELEPELQLRTFELSGDGYADGPAGSGDTVVRVQRPFACDVVPARLLD